MSKKNDWSDAAMTIPVPAKSVKAGLRPVDAEGNVKDDKPSSSLKQKTQQIRALLSERTEQLSTAKGILEVHPDLNLAKEITVAQVLAPKDLSDFKFRLRVNPVLYPGKVNPIAVARIQEVLNTHLELEEKVGDYLGDILYDHGAVVHLILPPAQIDSIVGQMDLESFDKASATDLFADIGVHTHTDPALTKAGIDGIHDNYKLFYRDSCRQHIINKNVSSGFDFENMSFATDHTEKKNEGCLVIDEIIEDERQTQALRIRLSPDIVMPLGDPSDKSKHHGYYILADDSGQLGTSCQDTGFMKDLLARMKKALHDETSNEYTIIKDLGFIEDSKDKKAKMSFDELMGRWVDFVEKPIREKIKSSGLVRGDVDVSEYHNFYRILLHRHLKQKKTRLIFVPAKLVSYMAMDYNDMGQGVSLLEKTAYYSSIRAIIQIAGVMNLVHNAIPVTDVAITLDEDDDDQLGTVETVLHELSKMTSLNFPIGTINPSEIVTSIQRAAYRVKIDGGTAFPKTSTELSDSGKSRVTQIDTEVDQQLRRLQYAGLGVSPEAIDQSLQGEFATQVILNDLLSAKRAMTKQRKFKKCLLDYIRRVIEFSPQFIKEIKDAGITDPAAFVRSLEIVMPTADMSRVEQHADAWDKISRFVDEVFPSIISDDMLRGMAGIDSQYTRDQLDDIRNIYASAYKRRYLKDNNILPEIWELIDPDSESGFNKEIPEHYRKVFKAIGPTVKAILKGIDNNDALIQKYLDNPKRKEDTDGTDTGSNPGNAGFGGAAPTPGAPVPGGADVFGSGVATPFSDDGEPFVEEDTGLDLEPGTDDEPGDPDVADPLAVTEDPIDLGLGGEEEEEADPLAGAEEETPDPLGEEEEPIDLDLTGEEEEDPADPDEVDPLAGEPEEVPEVTDPEDDPELDIDPDDPDTEDPLA
ncbi:virion structural protein [Vibrio phage vB_pir03]|nr:virion structural protein [Vibrio phage vB_pir03]